MSSYVPLGHPPLPGLLPPPPGADVYSYAPDEDDMVLDPKLREHLAHWGITMAAMEKTEKTMAELQVGGQGTVGRARAGGRGLLSVARQGYWQAGANLDVNSLAARRRARAQVDLNLRFEFDAITEAGAALVPLSGPGHVGLINLGNSCYMNSCLQVSRERDAQLMMHPRAGRQLA